MNPLVLIVGALALAVAFVVFADPPPSATDGAGGEGDDGDGGPQLPPGVGEGSIEAFAWRTAITSLIRGNTLPETRLGTGAIAPFIAEQWPAARAELRRLRLLPTSDVVQVLRAQRQAEREAQKWWRDVIEVALPVAAALLTLIPGVGPVLGPAATIAAQLAVSALKASWEGLPVTTAVAHSARQWIDDHPDFALMLAGADAATDDREAGESTAVDPELVA